MRIRLGKLVEGDKEMLMLRNTRMATLQSAAGSKKSTFEDLNQPSQSPELLQSPDRVPPEVGRPMLCRPTLKQNNSLHSAGSGGYPGVVERRVTAPTIEEGEIDKGVDEKSIVSAVRGIREAN